MAKDFLPKREAELLEWTSSFGERIAVSPEPLGITPQQIAQYAAAQESFTIAMRKAMSPYTRTSSAIAAKNDAKRILVKQTRMLARIVRGTPGVSSAMKLDLGLSIEKPGGYRPRLGPPRSVPTISVVSVLGKTVRVRLSDVASPTRQGRPRNCDGVVILTCIGCASPPADLNSWKHHTMSNNMVIDLAFGPEVPPGTMVWITGYWFNPRGERGRAAEPVCAYLQFGVTQAA